MKKRNMLGTMAFGLGCMILACSPVSAETTAEKAVDAYKDLLSQQYYAWESGEELASKNNETENFKFALTDLNGDGVKELILNNGQTSHAYGYVRVLSYIDGEVQELSISPHVMMKFYSSENVVFGYDVNAGIYAGTFYELGEDCELTEIAAFEAHDSNGGTNTIIYTDDDENVMYKYYSSCTVGGKEVSYSEYQKALEEYNIDDSDDAGDSLSHYDNTEENREKYLTADLTSDDDYVLPTSDSEYLSSDDLEGLSEDELRLARNEIFARHGRKFKDSTLQSYFNSKSWYEGTIDPDDFDENSLNKYEKANVKLIMEKENGTSSTSKSSSVKWYCANLSDDEDIGLDYWAVKDGYLVLKGNMKSASTRNAAEDKEYSYDELEYKLADDVTFTGQGGDGPDESYTQDEFVEYFMETTSGLHLEIKVEDGEITEVYIIS